MGITSRMTLVQAYACDNSPYASQHVGILWLVKTQERQDVKKTGGVFNTDVGCGNIWVKLLLVYPCVR